MAWRYRNASGRFVSEGMYNGARSRGWEGYKRESDKSYGEDKPAPKTADEWDAGWSGYDEFDEEYEIETGVDY